MFTSLTKYIPYYKNNLKIALPVVLTQVGGGMVALFDNIMVGHLGAVELAAVAFANSVYILGHVFAMGAVMGLTPLVGQAFVQKDTDYVKALFQNGLLYVLLLGVMMSVVLLMVYLGFDFMGQVPEVIVLAKPYYLIQILSLLPYLLFCLCKQFLEGLGNTKVAMNITMVSCVVNIVLNYLLIYGKLGFPRWGVVGAGVATLIARVLMPILFFVVLKYSSEFSSFLKWDKSIGGRCRYMKKIAQVGLPIGGHMLLECTAFAMCSIMVGWLGAVPLAANQIAQNISNLTFMLVVGIGSATTIRVSHRLGEGNFYALRMAGKASVHLCLLTNSLMALLMIVFASYIPRIFTTDVDVITTAAPLIILAGLFQISDGMQTVGVSILRGLTDVRRPVVYAFISYICINLPVGYYLGFICGLGEIGIWIGFIVGLSIAALLYHVRCYRQINKLEKQSVKSIE